MSRPWARLAVASLAFALVLGACGSTEASNRPASDLPVTASGTERPDTLIFVPVSGIGPLPCGPTGVAEADFQCLELGDTWVNQSAIETARVGAGGRAFAVYLVMTDDGIEAFNEVAGRCFAMIDDCSTGRLAIVEGDELVSAPQINAERFEKNGLVIAGDFDSDRAEALADAING